jgi:hypothetical protein
MRGFRVCRDLSTRRYLSEDALSWGVASYSAKTSRHCRTINSRSGVLPSSLWQRGPEVAKMIELVEKHRNLLIPYSPIMLARRNFAVFTRNAALREQREEGMRVTGVPVLATADNKQHGHLFHRNLRGKFEGVSILLLLRTELSHEIFILLPILSLHCRRICRQRRRLLVRRRQRPAEAADRGKHHGASGRETLRQIPP